MSLAEGKYSGNVEVGTPAVTPALLFSSSFTPTCSVSLFLFLFLQHLGQNIVSYGVCKELQKWRHTLKEI